MYYFDLIHGDEEICPIIATACWLLCWPRWKNEYPYQMFAIAGLLAAKAGDVGRKSRNVRGVRPFRQQRHGPRRTCWFGTGWLRGPAVPCGTSARIIDVEEDDWELIKGVEILEKRFGEAEAWIELERMAAENSVIAAWLEIVKQTRAKWKETRETVRPKRPALPYEELKALIAEKGRKLHAKVRLWHKKASAEVFTQAARDLLTETDPDRLVPYLRIFSQCGFPLDPAPIIALADSEDEFISWEALRTLEHTKHPAVRAFALNCLESSRHLHWVVGMLDTNYKSGDEAAIANLTAIKMNPDEYHHMQSCARDFVEKRWDAYSVPILLNLYENGPCSLCREVSVKLLIEHDALPDWMRDEARYDADENCRALFSKKEENQARNE